MLAFPAPVLAQEGDDLNRPITVGDLDRMEGRLGAKLDTLGRDLGTQLDSLGTKVDALGRDLGTKLDSLGAKLDALGERIDALTRVVWVAFGLMVVLFLAIIALMHRNAKISVRN